MDNHAVLTIGRCLIALLFLWSGYDKIRLWAMTKHVMQAHGIPLVPLALPAAIALEIACALLLFANLFVPLAAVLLALFVAVSSLMIPVRDMQSTTDPKERHLYQVIVGGNVGLIGGLLYLFGSSS